MEDKILSIINEIRKEKSLTILKNLTGIENLRTDLNFSSFDLAELTVMIEDEFDIDIFEDGIINTVGEIFEKLR